jgi:hypothetical protein
MKTSLISLFSLLPFFIKTLMYLKSNGYPAILDLLLSMAILPPYFNLILGNSLSVCAIYNDYSVSDY